MKDEIAAWAQAGKQQSLPAWEELPNIPLYMDQVIFCLKDSLRLFETEEEGSLLTGSMINNYVKNGVLPHPEKKRYNREHLAALTAICMLKQVLPIGDVRLLLEGGELPQLYELFREAHHAAMRETCARLEERCEAGADLKEEALRMAVEANARRAAALQILSRFERPADKKDKKKEEKA